jgi:mRNA interferase MazF
VTFKPFDVVTFAFPFVEKAGYVTRPVVVLSGHAGFSAESGISIVVMITSAKRTAWPLDFEITDLAVAGLTRPCVVRMKINSAAHELVDRHIGTLSETDRGSLIAATRQLFPFL